eukprot:6566867-Alexandrium_andersonii.AAC.1
MRSAPRRMERRQTPMGDRQPRATHFWSGKPLGSFRTVPQDSFRTASRHFQNSFKAASGRLQDSFRTAS